MWLSPQRVGERSERLAELAADHGRARPRTALLILTRIDDDAAHGRAVAEAHVAGQYRMGLEAIERWMLLDSIDGAVQRLGEYMEVGVDEFLLLTLGDDTLEQYERLAEVRSHLQALTPAPAGR
jgi:alkanesulfonate monooxygenase SsuD/methylene tetrahydromethanopterin reductase-like flavin-dependent oxidoreductase (luciferase family)